MRAIIILSLSLACCIVGCKKSGDNPVTPPGDAGDWSFPADPNKFSLTLIASDSTPAVGESLELKAVLYNVTNVFGVAMDITYPADKVEINGIQTGPYLSPDTAAITVSMIDTASGKISYGISFKAGSATVKSGSGVVMKLLCTAKAPGSVPFAVDAQTLQIVGADGSPVPNFSTLGIENTAVTVP
jgi:hypothetical protein